MGVVRRLLESLLSCYSLLEVLEPVSFVMTTINIKVQANDNLSKPLHNLSFLKLLSLSILSLLVLRPYMHIQFSYMVSEPRSMEASTNNSQNPSFLSTIQLPLLLLNNMSNLMSIKLDSTNYIVWYTIIRIAIQLFGCVSLSGIFIP